MSNVQIMCAWCQKVGIKRYSLSMGSEVKSFCSEKCFAACRRAYFKRNKVRARRERGPSQASKTTCACVPLSFLLKTLRTFDFDSFWFVSSLSLSYLTFWNKESPSNVQPVLQFLLSRCLNSERVNESDEDMVIAAGILRDSLSSSRVHRLESVKDKW